jgi:hypothetical protein
MTTTPFEGDRTCELCGRQFGNEFELEDHMRRAHDRSLTSDEPRGPGEDPEGNDPLDPEAMEPEDDDVVDDQQTSGGSGRV